MEKLAYPAGTRVLKEVIIKDRKVVKGSHNLNGPGEADQVLDEDDMKKAGKATLMDLLYKDVKGFTPFKVHEKN